MAYVPGYQHDVFISYAHGDDRDWIDRLVARLKLVIERRLGVEANIWIDDKNLRKSQNFEKEIPERLGGSAVFVLLPSPKYIRSKYCVDVECKIFEKTITTKRARFKTDKLANSLFAVRCPIMPVENNEHWELFRGLSDIAFCNDEETFAIDTPNFESSFRTLSFELERLLKCMRNDSTSVFVYPPDPGSDVQDAFKALEAELLARSYRLLPDRKLNLSGQLREASLSVFLLGTAYDNGAKELVEIAKHMEKPWVAWCSPAASEKGAAEQVGFCTYIEQIESANKTYLDAKTAPSKLKEEVLALLSPEPSLRSVPEGKPHIYLICNLRENGEKGRAGRIAFHYREAFHFDMPDDPGKHTLRLTSSDGVLLIWGNANESWCSREFEEMMRRRTEVRGLCVFDPKEPKTAALQKLRENYSDLCIIEEFGEFDPAHLEIFFNPIQRRSKAVAS